MEQPRKIYRILVNNDKGAVEVEDYVIAYFKTLKTMIDDFGENNDGVTLLPPFPLYLEYMTSCMLRKMVEFYKLFVEEKRDITPNSPEEKALVSRLLKTVAPDLTEQELVSFAKASNFLYANEFLNAIIDALKEPLLTMPTEALRIKAEKLLRPDDNNKRKAELGVEDAELWGDPILWRSTRIQYRRELFIQRIMGILLGDSDAGPRIDRRIRRFADPLIGFTESLLVRYHAPSKEAADDSIFLHQDTEVFENFQIPASVLSWSRGIRALYKEKINDVVMGELFIAILNDAGKLSIYGEHGGQHAGFEATIEIDERPTGSEECIAMWAANGRLFALTSEELTVHQGGDDRKVDLGGLPPSSVLEVYPYNDGALLLTHEGLFTWTVPETFSWNSEDSDYDISDEERAAHPVIKKFDVLGLGVERVWTTTEAVFVVASDGRLYVKGNGSNGELGLGLTGATKYGEVNTGKKWLAVDFGTELTNEIDKLGGIRLILGTRTGSLSRRMVIVAGNQLYATNSKTGLFERVKNGNFTGNRGNVVSVVALPSNTFLVATTTGLYVLGTNPTGEIYKMLGGSDSIGEPYELNIPYNGKAYNAVTVNVSNKKARTDLSCTMCFAHALFAYKHTHAVCSPYCARKIDK